MPNINITVANKIATNMSPGVHIVCGNNDYTLTFSFDEEWSTHAFKTARFVYTRDGKVLHTESVFSGNVANVPVLSGITSVYVGVYAGELHTTTPAKVLCERSILCAGGTHEEPPEDVYHQILEEVNKLAGLGTDHAAIIGNPHKTTAAEVGARPDTWTPTAEEVGARPNTWTPTAEEVGARPDTWTPTAEEVGARPNTWIPTAEEVGARPDTWMPTASEVGAAPAGYGLGGAGAWADDLNNATANGFYSWTDTSANKPFNYGNLLVLNRGNSRITQIGVDPNMVGHREMAVRHRNSDNAWSQWEYINPPMMLGVEYPTVERYRGKRVYTKAIDFGSMPNASVKSVNHNIADLGACISAVGTTSDGGAFGYYFPLYNSSAVNGQVGIYVTKAAIQLTATADWSNYNATIILKYTKTTD